MASISEIAIGVATALSSGMVPDPMFLDFWNETPEEAVELLQAVVNECADAGIPLRKIAVDPVLWAALPPTCRGDVRGVGIEADRELVGRVAFYREA